MPELVYLHNKGRDSVVSGIAPQFKPKRRTPSAQPHTPSDEDIAAFIAVLKRGAANAVHSYDIGLALGFTGRRENIQRAVRNLAHFATARGHLFGADNDGYFIPETIEECERTLRRLRSEAMKMYRRYKTMQRLTREQFIAHTRPML